MVSNAKQQFQKISNCNDNSCNNNNNNKNKNNKSTWFATLLGRVNLCFISSVNFKIFILFLLVISFVKVGDNGVFNCVNRLLICV